MSDDLRYEVTVGDTLSQTELKKMAAYKQEKVINVDFTSGLEQSSLFCINETSVCIYKIMLKIQLNGRSQNLTAYDTITILS